MHRKIIASVALVAATLGAAPKGLTQPAPQEAPPPEAVRGQIEAATNAWTLATQGKDLPALRTMMAPEFTLTGGDGRDPLPLDLWLNNLEQMRFDNYQTRVTDVRTYGSIAIATVEGEWTVTLRGGRLEGPFLLADFWIFRDGRWQVFRRHRIR
jgi:ketosteroid isomerase-like protein